MCSQIQTRFLRTQAAAPRRRSCLWSDTWLARRLTTTEWGLWRWLRTHWRSRWSCSSSLCFMYAQGVSILSLPLHSRTGHSYIPKLYTCTYFHDPISILDQNVYDYNAIIAYVLPILFFLQICWGKKSRYWHQAIQHDDPDLLALLSFFLTDDPWWLVEGKILKPLKGALSIHFRVCLSVCLYASYWPQFLS